MPKNKGKGGKNRRRGKNENEGAKRELILKEEGQVIFKINFKSSLIPTGNIYKNCRAHSALSFEYICSVEILNRIRDIIEKLGVRPSAEDVGKWSSGGDVFRRNKTIVSYSG